MSTIRIIKTSSITLDKEYYLRDSRLSLKAKGLLTQLFTYSHGSDFTIEEVKYYTKDSTKSIRSAIRELEQTNYLERKQERDMFGQMLPVDYVIYENPYEGISIPELDDFDDPDDLFFIDPEELDDSDDILIFDPEAFDKPETDPTSPDYDHMTRLISLIEDMLNTINDYLLNQLLENYNRTRD